MGSLRRCAGTKSASCFSRSACCPCSAPTRTSRSEERRVGKECRSRCDWSSDVCSSDLATMSDGQLTEMRRHKIGFVFQSFGLLPLLSAYENVEVGRASCRERV